MNKPNIGLIEPRELMLFGAYYAFTSGRANLDVMTAPIADGGKPIPQTVTQAYFFRKVPEHLGSYVIFAGLEQVIAFIQAMQCDGQNANLSVPLSPEMVEWFNKTSGGDMNSKFMD